MGKIRALSEAHPDYLYNQVEFVWFTRHPLPYEIVLDRGNEFIVAEFIIPLIIII